MLLNTNYQVLKRDWRWPALEQLQIACSTVIFNLILLILDHFF